MKATRDVVSENLVRTSTKIAGDACTTASTKKSCGTNCAPSVYTAHISGNHKPSPYLRRFRLPSLNNSPTQSYEDILSPITDQLPRGIAAHGISANGYSSSSTPEKIRRPTAVGTLQGKNLSNEDLRSCPDTYSRTLKELELLKQRRPGSTSDYFSMTSSVCSDVSDSGDLYSPWGVERAEQGPLAAEGGISATLMQISIETEALEKRNRQLQEGNCDSVFEK